MLYNARHDNAIEDIFYGLEEPVMNKNNKMETVIIQTRRGNETKGVVGRIAD